MTELHVTNGDCAADVLRKAGMKGDLLPWRDVLHEGPLDPSLSLSDFSAVRARFIADEGWAPYEDVKRQLGERDARLKHAASDEEVVLWFEHDLYDQLQLIQLLAWFREHPHPRLSLVCEAEYLGEMKPERAAALFRVRRPVTAEQIDQGSRAWHGLPEAQGFPALPFLDPALRRFAAERATPSKTETLALSALADGALTFEALFRRTQALDEPRFMGDTVFMKRLQRLQAAGRIQRIGDRWCLA